VFKPSTVRSYEASLRLHVLDEFGGRKLSDIAAADLQGVVERMQAAGADASTIRNTVNGVRAIFRRACRPGGEVAVNPTAGLELPAVRGRRDRVADPAEAALLLQALPVDDRALWATACYAGLRLGELKALTYDRTDGLDLAGGMIHVRRSWDQYEGPVAPKSHAWVRDIPIAGVLRDYLLAHRARSGRDHGLVFGRTETVPVAAVSLMKRAQDAWTAANVKRAEQRLARSRRSASTS
jgi:integrase